MARYTGRRAKRRNANPLSGQELAKVAKVAKIAKIANFFG
jgi:hypothetical protein